MAPKNGNDFVLSIGGTAVGSQRSVSINRTADMIDQSAKGDDDATFLFGRRGGTIELDNLYIEGDTAYDAIESAFNNGTTVAATLVRSSTSSTLKTATCYIESFNETWSDNDIATATMTLRIDGAVT